MTDVIYASPALRPPKKKAEPVENSQKIPSVRFSTSSLPVRDRFDVWRQHLLPFLEIVPGDTLDRDCRAEISTWALGPFILSRAINSRVDFLRTANCLRLGAGNHWPICVVKQGRHYVSPDDEPDFRNETEQARLYYSRFLGKGRLSDGDHLMLFIPRDLFPAQAGAIDHLGNALLTSPLSGLLVDYLTSLERQVGRLKADNVPKIVEATRAMVAACLVPTSDNVAEAVPAISAINTDRAKRVVLERLRDPKLTPDSLAEAIGVSHSTLYRLFEPYGGVMRYVQTQRLMAIYDALRNPQEYRRIHQVAESYGFVIASDFSRAFRREFGYSAREVRNGRQSSSGQMHRQQKKSTAPATLGEFLKRHL